MPAPNHFTALPDRSNLKMGARFDSVQLRSPHLSKTQMLPSRSTSTADVDPYFLPSGYFAQPSSTRYGLSCAYADGNIETIAAMRVNIIGKKSRKTMTSLGETNRRKAPLKPVRVKMRIQKATGWKTQPGMVQKVVENSVCCQATLSSLGVKAKSVFCCRESLSIFSYSYL